jgi:hypothetical protein
MARNIALFGAREVLNQRRWVSGVTASTPLYLSVDSLGHKEWVVDVYLGMGPEGDVNENILTKVPIAPYARHLVTGIRQPVMLERSRQGGYTVTGRAKTVAAGTLSQNGDVLEATYHCIKHNLADLRLRHVADIDYTLAPFQAVFGVTPLQPVPGTSPLQVVGMTDAFGVPVTGDVYSIDPDVETTTRHVRIALATLGPKGDPLAMQWGVVGSILQPTYQEIIELVT